MPVRFAGFRSPIFWLAIQALLVFTILQWWGRFELEYRPDTYSYVDATLWPLSDALAQNRTLGYPLYLRAVEILFGNLELAPFGHFVFHVAAVFVFYLSLRAIRFQPGAATCAASALLYSRVMFEFTRWILADSLACSMAVLTICALLVVLDQPRRYWVWLGLSLSLFATYQIRPAYLFLIPLIPVLGICLRILVLFPADRRVDWKRLLLALAAAAIIPFLAYATFRLVIVGHFGLVSRGGYHAIGIAGQFLEESTIPRLSEDLRPLAQQIITYRQTFSGWQEPTNYWAMYDNVPTHKEIYGPATFAVYGDDLVQINDAMGRLSAELNAIYARRYALWLYWAARESLASLGFLMMLDKGVRLSLLFLLIAQLVVVWRIWRGREPISNTVPAESYAREINTILALALSFAAGKVMLIVIVDGANHRFLTAAMLFGPPLMAVLAWVRCARVFRNNDALIS